jgi:membrane-associated protease RseP (regulator of RpoE activity)
LAQAGWVGILVTALNLMPFGQFDGGHVVYALVRDLQRLVGVFMLMLLVFLGFDFWFWWAWGAFILIVSGGRIGHPSVLEYERPLPRNRRVLGVATIALLAVTFIRVPFA